MIRNNKNKKFCTVMLLCLLLSVWNAAGCGAKEALGEGEGSAAGTDGRRAEGGGLDMTSVTWIRGEDIVDSAESWASVVYWDSCLADAPVLNLELSGRYSAADASGYYILDRYRALAVGPGSQKYYLTRLDKDTLAAETEELKLRGAVDGVAGELAEGLIKDLDENWTIITGISVFEGKLCLLAQQMDREEKVPSHCYIVWVDAEGRVESMQDVLPEMQNAGMREGNILPAGILYDSEGCYYIGTENSTSGIGVFGEDGMFLKYVEDPRGRDVPVGVSFRLPDGKVVFECTRRGETALFYLENGTEKMLYDGKDGGETAYCRYAGSAGNVLYAGNSGIVRWNVETGAMERLYRDASTKPWAYEAVWETEDGGIAVVSDEWPSITAQLLRPGTEAEERTAVLFQVSDDSFLKRCADEFTRRNPGIRIEVQTLDISDGFDIAFQRFAAQLASGDGPDMFVLNWNQLKDLQDAGVLASLEGIWPEEIRSQIFPGVLEAGELDGTLYGMSTQCGVNTLAVSEELWQSGTWDYSDIISLMETNEGLLCVMEGYPAVNLLIQLTAGLEGGETSLLDIEEGKCYFDTEEFVNLLELCKAYGTESDSYSKDKILIHSITGNLLQVGHQMAELGSGYRCLGYPAQSGRIKFVQCDSFIAVSGKAENMDIVEEFLRYLLSDRVQKSVAYASVRRDILCGSVVEQYGDKEGPVAILDVGVAPLNAKPDGSSFLPEYLEILDNAVPLTGYHRVITNILLEESQAFFSGDKTAKTAAGIIQSRVQLYLDEK